MELKEMLKRPNIKFRNPETGEVFNNLQQASDAFCLTYDSFCHGCPIDKASMGHSCLAWIKEHPHKAARLMGFEAVEETVDCTPCRTCAFPYPSIMCVNCGTEYRNYEKKKEDANMDKPRIAQVLGVEVGERFCIKGFCEKDVEFCIKNDGTFSTRPSNVQGSSVALLRTLDHLNRIIRKPKQEQEEKKVDKPRICEVSEDDFEEICEAVHNGWMDEKKRQGMTEHPDMHPYHELPENVKEYDRVTVRCVLDALGIKYTQKPRWTQQEVEFARLFNAACKNVVWIQRNDEKTLVWVVEHSNEEYRLPFRLFPNIQPGHSYTLDEIIGGAE